MSRWFALLLYPPNTLISPTLCTIFTILLTFFGKSCNEHMLQCSMLQVCIIAIWSQGLILNSGRSYATFGTKIPVFRANSGCLLGTKWQKLWIYKSVGRIVKIIHSVVCMQIMPSWYNNVWADHIHRKSIKICPFCCCYTILDSDSWIFDLPTSTILAIDDWPDLAFYLNYLHMDKKGHQI